MQEALKNPHYKKIWEKVNWQGRHPESESLKEALGRELQEMYCSYIAFDNLYITNKNFDVPYAYGNSISQILGRPITLEDILLLIPDFLETEKFLDSSGWSVVLRTDERYHYIEINWQLTTPLHEQTPETWEEIANLIN